jgi:glycine betaine catabolism A
MAPKLNSNRILEMVSQQQIGWSLDRPFYTEPEILDLDIHKVWMSNWIYVGHISQLPKPGSYFTYQVSDEPVIILRDEQGKVQALMNICRHRGSLICNDPQGQVKKLVCPYHQWVYDLDGKLRSAKLMPDDFDRSDFSLHRLKVQVIEGFIFISFSEDPPSFESLSECVLPHLEIYDLSEIKIAFSKEYLVQSNWKLIVENFRECYHCGSGHPEYCNIVSGMNLDKSRIKAEQIRKRKLVEWEAKGIPTQPVWFDTPQAWYHCMRYPYQDDKQTMSLDGKQVAPPLGSIGDIDVGIFTLVMYPGFWLDVNNDYAWTLSIRPVSPRLTVADVRWYVRQDAVEGVDYDTEQLSIFWRITAEQDWKLCEDNQTGVNSHFYRPGPYSNIAEIGPEGGPDQFVAWYLNHLKV